MRTRGLKYLTPPLYNLLKLAKEVGLMSKRGREKCGNEKSWLVPLGHQHKLKKVKTKTISWIQVYLLKQWKLQICWIHYENL